MYCLFYFCFIFWKIRSSCLRLNSFNMESLSSLFKKNNTEVRCNHNPSPSAFFFLIQSLIIRAFPNSSYAYEYRTKASSGFFSLICIQGPVKTVGKYPQKNKAIQDKHIRVACDDELYHKLPHHISFNITSKYHAL